MAATEAGHQSLRHISIDAVAQLRSTPTQKIRTDEDLDLWRTTTGYRDFAVFLRRLSESVVGYTLPWSPPSQSEVSAPANYAGMRD